MMKLVVLLLVWLVILFYAVSVFGKGSDFTNGEVFEGVPFKTYKHVVNRLKVKCGYIWVVYHARGAGITFQPDGSCTPTVGR